MVEQVDAGDQAEELVAVEDDGHVVGAEDRQQSLDVGADLEQALAAASNLVDLLAGITYLGSRAYSSMGPEWMPSMAARSFT